MKTRALVVLFAFVPALVLGSCGQQGDAGKGGKGAASGGRGGKGGVAFGVDVIEVEAKAVEYVVQAPGQLDAFERVQVTSRVAGVVDKVSFTEGQEVKKGDVLVIIESERYMLAVNTAKAVQAKANAAYADAEAMVARREKASAEHPGLIPAEELATFKTKALTAKADAAAAESALRVAMVNLRDAYVRAPMTGTIQTRTVETGQYVNTGFLMATLLREDPMLLRFQVEPKDAPRLKPGMIANFTLRETQRTYSAKLTLIAGAAEVATHTIGVTGEVIDEGHKYWLRPGSFCDVTVGLNATREAPIIPRTAARATDKGYIVYVIEEGVAIEKPVTLGMNTKDGRIEVRSGLRAGEWLVVRGAEALSTGATVKANKIKWEAPAPSASASIKPSDIPLPEGPAGESGTGGDAGVVKKEPNKDPDKKGKGDWQGKKAKP